MIKSTLNHNIARCDIARCDCLCLQVGHWQDMQSGLKGGTVDKELLDFEAGLEQEAGARFDKSSFCSIIIDK